MRFLDDVLLFFSYTLFPLLLLLDASVDSRSSKSVDSEEKFEIFNSSKSPHRVNDIVAEGVLQCLEELLRKCHLGSVEQVSSVKMLFCIKLNVMIINLLLDFLD